MKKVLLSILCAMFLIPTFAAHLTIKVGEIGRLDHTPPDYPYFDSKWETITGSYYIKITSQSGTYCYVQGLKKTDEEGALVKHFWSYKNAFGYKVDKVEFLYVKVVDPNEDPNNPSGNTEFKIIKSDPKDGATDVPIDVKPKVWFNQDIGFYDSKPLERWVYIVDDDGKKIYVNTKSSSNSYANEYVAVFTPQEELEYNTHYVLVVPYAAYKGKWSETPLTEFRLNFTTKDFSDEPDGDDEAYAALSEDKQTLTFYYDGKCKSRNGMRLGVFDEKNELKWLNNSATITKVVFDDSFADFKNVTRTLRWFDSFEKLTSIVGLSNLNTSNVTDMGHMFYHCSSLTSLDLRSFDTSNVKSMYMMFCGCSSLTNLDMSSFNTSNVTDMGDMFCNCSAITNIDVSNFNTTKVEKMSEMFLGCSSLTSVDLTNFETSNVQSFSYMFRECTNLTDVDLSSFNTSNVTHMYGMFYKCSKLTTIYVGNEWSTANVEYGEIMFGSCKNLKGEKGTVYNSSHTDHAYAHIDGGTSNPGYFTGKKTNNISGPIGCDPLFDSKWYSIDGRSSENSPTKKGIYIRNGKKIVIH